jgi:tRNA threonylcarbamoyladenosine biosynthesis protein TsaE
MLYQLNNIEQTIALAQKIAPIITSPFVITFNGGLGAGKTTIIRYILQAMGVTETIKSPTYTLVESYTYNQIELHHFDLYRFNDPDEWFDSGFDEYFNANSICFIEWPTKAPQLTIHTDWAIDITITNTQHRILNITALSPKGKICLDQLTV